MQLSTIVDSGDLPILVQAADCPVVAGIQPDGIDIPCPGCHSSILLHQVVDGEIYDIALRCRCGCLSATPRLPPGRGVGGVVHDITTGVHYVASTLENTEGAIVIGAPGIGRRAAESGVGAHLQAGVSLDAEGINTVLADAQAVFSPILVKLQTKHNKTLRHPGSHPSRHHRLAQLVHSVDQTLAGVRAENREIDVLSVVELANAASLFRRWELDPMVASMIRACHQVDDYYHSLAVLSVASALADAQLGAELTPPGPNRTADITVRLALRQKFTVEVKAPQALQRRPFVALERTEIDDLVVKAIKSAGTQLSSIAPSVLALGGTFWSADFDRVDATARSMWAAKGSRRPNVIGLILASVGVAMKRNRGKGEWRPDAWEDVDWTWESAFRWVPNPWYSGALKVTFPKDLSRYDITYPATPSPGG
jgi:hypothetical protein